MYLCDRCQKGMQVGMNVSHSHRRSKKHALPNLHVVTLKVEGRRQTLRLCTKCNRIMRAQFPYVADEESKEPATKTVAKKEVKAQTPEVIEEAAPQEA